MKKLGRLKEILLPMLSALVAYSGGADSTFLLKVASDVLGNRVVAVTARSETYPIRELEEAKRIAGKLRVKHVIIKTQELHNGKFTSNPPDRCYYCKKELFSKLWKIAKKFELNYILDGSNYDDINDFRPGSRAGEELGVRSPLKEAGFTKDDIRILSRKMKLSTWDKPSAACLASRFPYGDRITPTGLLRLEKAEESLRRLGVRQVRVRHHGNIARIEISPADFQKLLSDRVSARVVKEIKRLGYDYVTLDIQGYRTGSMNDPLRRNTHSRKRK
jgi:uncharacterized protein